ncbi:hypothetical protein F5Y00DRAFT_228365 [Daldinia vernicosa]|uniref:uncharacterized protein n=1 Tax=Daldinia vernicosa TaxID=114800 RepID=UPI0020078AD2|nr:uncharacterized protein F5Y00DRAFT_228365 [Daldinia vernicosa]KAI0851995.1 hypothetical protein F5Y00DRAFT_228365 [Daldinia vernicosa]
MKCWNFFLRIVVILGTSHALSIQMPIEDTSKPQNHTLDMSALSLGGNATNYLETFGSYNNTVSATNPNWTIPVSHWGCTRAKLRRDDIKETIQLMIDWSSRGGGVWGRDYHIELQPQAAAYLCNCKIRGLDYAPENEMWEFYERLRINCGEGWTGWIFSKRWEKGWAVHTRTYVDDFHPKRHLCPVFCCV